MSLAPGFHQLWPTPLGVHRLPGADDLNPLLVRVFGAMRATQALTQAHGRADAPTAFFASSDDLLRRVQLPEWQAFVRFLVDCLSETAKQANAGRWPAAGIELKVAIEGLWFQISNQGAFHDVHTHGNCSWSGVYVVQVDADEARCAHPVYGAANGVTRFYGPPFTHLAGAHADLGNVYLQPPHVDVAPVPGQLVLFPSWLAHQAMPYAGTRDRIIVSFNASLHAAQGSNRVFGFSGA